MGFGNFDEAYQGDAKYQSSSRRLVIYVRLALIFLAWDLSGKKTRLCYIAVGRDHGGRLP